MHELSLCQQIIAIVQAKQNLFAGKTIIAVYVEIGELLAVETSALLFGFDILKKNTPLEQANLHLISKPGLAHCQSCQVTVKISRYDHCCSRCHELALTIIEGEELKVISIEVT